LRIVLDASVLVATLSPAERHHDLARRLYAIRPPAVPFLVPAVFRVEVLSALRRQGAPTELIDAADALVRGPTFRSAAVAAGLLDDAATLARAAGLRAYDALYAALAWRQQAVLLTLDREVVARLQSCYPEIDVRSESPADGDATHTAPR
jgi:predicted nucleic acid-binding protein